MNRARCIPALLVAVAVISYSSGVAFGTFIPMTGDPVPLESLLPGEFAFGDKVFSEFDLTANAGGGAITPSASTVLVQGGMDDQTGDYALRWLMAWNAGSGQSVEATISFQVAIIDISNLWIEDAALVLTGASATGGGAVQITETVSNVPVGLGPTIVLALLDCSKVDSDGGANLADHAVFGPIKKIGVVKNITLTGGIGAVGAAHLSEFYQFYSQVPEPASLAVLLAGGLAALLRRRR